MLQRELWAEATREAMEAVQAGGVEVIRPPKEPFSEAVTSIYDELRSQPGLFTLSERIKAVR